MTQRSAIHDTCQSRVGNGSSRRKIIVRSKDRRAGSSVAKFYFHEWPQIRGFQVICCIVVFESIWLFHKSEVSLKFWKRIQGAFLIISTVTLQVKGRQASFCFRKKCPAVFLLKQPVINQVLKRKGGFFRAVTRCYTFEAFLWCTASKLRRFTLIKSKSLRNKLQTGITWTTFPTTLGSPDQSESDISRLPNRVALIDDLALIDSCNSEIIE